MRNSHLLHINLSRFLLLRNLAPLPIILSPLRGNGAVQFLRFGDRFRCFRSSDSTQHLLARLAQPLRTFAQFSSSTSACTI